MEKLLESKDIFQFLLKNYVKKDYKVNRNEILKADDIINILDKTVNNNFVLAETLLYFFEKNALNYLQIINSKKETIKLEDEPLDILKDCYDVLNFYIFEPKKLG